MSLKERVHDLPALGQHGCRRRGPHPRRHSPARRPGAGMSRLSLGGIADDFTGATAPANLLARGGMRVLQTTGVPGAAPDTEADAIVVALKSRTIAASVAVARSLAALQWLRAQGAQQ